MAIISTSVEYVFDIFTGSPPNLRNAITLGHVQQSFKDTPLNHQHVRGSLYEHVLGQITYVELVKWRACGLAIASMYKRDNEVGLSASRTVYSYVLAA